MSLFRKLFHLTRQQRLPRLRRSLINPRQIHNVSDDEKLLIMSGLVRDQLAAQGMMHKMEVDNALDLLPLLTAKPKANWRKRAMNLLRSLEGSYPTDPFKTELRRIRRMNRVRK